MQEKMNASDVVIDYTYEDYFHGSLAKESDMSDNTDYVTTSSYRVGFWRPARGAGSVRFAWTTIVVFVSLLVLLLVWFAYKSFVAHKKPPPPIDAEAPPAVVAKKKVAVQ